MLVADLSVRSESPHKRGTEEECSVAGTERKEGVFQIVIMTNPFNKMVGSTSTEFTTQMNILKAS